MPARRAPDSNLIGENTAGIAPTKADAILIDGVHYGTFISTTWQMEVSSVKTAPVPAGRYPLHDQADLQGARRWGDVSRFGRSRETMRRGDGEDVRRYVAHRACAADRCGDVGASTVKAANVRACRKAADGQKSDHRNDEGAGEKISQPFVQYGAGCRTRTRHLMITKQLKYTEIAMTYKVSTFPKPVASLVSQPDLVKHLAELETHHASLYAFDTSMKTYSGRSGLLK